MTIPKYEWTEEQDEFIKVNFRKIKNAEIAKHLGVDRRAVEKRVNEIIHPLFRHSHKWTSIEDEILYQYYGKMPMERLSYILKRTIKGIVTRMHNLEGCADTASVGGFLIPSDIAAFMGVSTRIITIWINEGLLEAHRPNYKFTIDEGYFWSWLSDNLDRVNFKNIDDAILNIVPEWYSKLISENKREIHSNQLLKKLNTPYSPIENALLWDMFLKGYTRTQMSNELGRTYYSVRNQLLKLKKQKMKRVA